MVIDFNPDQKLIFEHIRTSDDNLLINARAGAGKTTTIVEALNLIPEDQKVLFLAFNKHIANELKERVPKGVYVCTFHSLGWRAIKKMFKEAELDNFKADKVIQHLARKWTLQEHIEDEDSYFAGIRKMVNLARLTNRLSKLQILDLAKKHDLEFDTVDASRVLKVLDRMMKDHATFDFTDMVFLPATDHRVFLLKYDCVFVDEAQDLSKVQQMMLRRSIKPGGRFVAVGDENQNIMGFAGTDEYSFNNLAKSRNTVTLPLSCSYRCSKSVVKAAQKLVPDIEHTSWAVDGVVRDGSILDEARPGDFVLCRTVKPLVVLFFELLTAQKQVSLKSEEVGTMLRKMVEPMRHESIGQLSLHLQKSLDAYRQRLLKKGLVNIDEHHGYTQYKDYVGILEILISNCRSCPEVLEFVDMIFKDTGHGIMLSTIHKTKGLEADRVFICRPDLIPMKSAQAWIRQQELNLEYVAITRAKHSLIYDHSWSDE